MLAILCRIRNSQGSLDSIETGAASSAGSRASSSCGSNTKMDGGSGNGDVNMSATNASNQSAYSLSSAHTNRDHWSKMPETINGHKIEARERGINIKRSIGNCSIKQAIAASVCSSSSGRTKGISPNFGYVKRSNGTITATGEQPNHAMVMNLGNGSPNARTAHVAAISRSTPLSGRKSSGGTQTLPNDITSNYTVILYLNKIQFRFNKLLLIVVEIPSNAQHRSYSLTGPGASQLSQSIRERLATGSHSLPKPTTDIYQHR